MEAFYFWSPGCQQPYGAAYTFINSSNNKGKDLQLVIGAIVKMEDTGLTDMSHKADNTSPQHKGVSTKTKTELKENRYQTDIQLERNASLNEELAKV